MLFLQSKAEAMPRMWRSACGTVDRIYQDQSTIILITDEKKRVLLITWKDRTQVYRNGKRVKELDLKEGSHLCLHYRAPMFGERWATKIVLNDTKSEGGKTGEGQSGLVAQGSGN